MVPKKAGDRPNSSGSIFDCFTTYQSVLLLWSVHDSGKRIKAEVTHYLKFGLSFFPSSPTVCVLTCNCVLLALVCDKTL